MAAQKSITGQTLIPLGVAVSLAVSAVGFVRGYDSNAHARDTEVLDIKSQVSALESRVTDIRAKDERDDARWDRIVEDLNSIKVRLGIVEAKPSK